MTVDFKRIRQSIDAPSKEYLKKIDCYIQHLRTLPPEEAKREAYESLYRSSIINQDDTPKTTPDKFLAPCI